MKFETEHFVQARRIAAQWRKDGYSQVVVVRERARAKRCYPCRQHDVPPRAVGSWDYYPIPTLDRLMERPPAEESASRAELWIAATIVYGCRYPSASVHLGPTPGGRGENSTARS